MIEQFGLAALYPEMLLAFMATLVLLLDLAVKTPLRTLTYGLSMLTLGVVAWMQADEIGRAHV